MDTNNFILSQITEMGDKLASGWSSQANSRVPQQELCYVFCALWGQHVYEREWEEQACSGSDPDARQCPQPTSPLNPEEAGTQRASTAPAEEDEAAGPGDCPATPWGRANPPLTSGGIRY